MTARRQLALAAAALTLGACGHVEPDSGNADAGAAGITICSVIAPGPTCGNVNMYMCNSSETSRTVRVTRRFAFGDTQTFSVRLGVPAKATTENGLAPFIGRDEHSNSSGRCTPVIYNLELQ